MDHRCKGKGRAELRPVRRPPVTSPPLPQSVPSPARKLEAGKGLARLAQAEQHLDRGSVLSRLGTDLQLRRCEAHSVLSNTGLQEPANGLTHLSRVLGLGIQAWAQSTAWSSLLRGWFPYAGAVLGSPNAQVKAPKHIHTSLLCNRAPGKPSLTGAFWAQTEEHSGCGAPSQRLGH